MVTPGLRSTLEWQLFRITLFHSGLVVATSSSRGLPSPCSPQQSLTTSQDPQLVATSVLLGLPLGSLFAFVAGILPLLIVELKLLNQGGFQSQCLNLSTPTKIFSLVGSNVEIVLFFFCTVSLVVPVQFSRLVKHTCPCNIFLCELCESYIFEKLGLHCIGALVARAVTALATWGSPTHCLIDFLLQTFQDDNKFRNRQASKLELLEEGRRILLSPTLCNVFIMFAPSDDFSLPLFLDGGHLRSSRLFAFLKMELYANLN